MKKLILLALAALIMVGCVEQKKEAKYVNETNVTHYRKKSTDTIFVVIDSCEYIVNKEKYAFAYTKGYYVTYTHKGNCRYCAERRKQELKELLEELKGLKE